MENKIIFEVALMLISGILCGRIAKHLKMPNVTGYLIAGLLLGPSVFQIIPESMVSGFGVISDIALAFIAFSVGVGFSLEYFKKVGAAPIIIAIFESFGAIILVSLVLILCGFDVKLSIMLGAIAAATAPAQTIMVIKQYQAKGSLTSMLLSVVAIDDAVALIGFGVASTIVKAMGSSNVSLMMNILNPVYQIVVSLLIGAVFAILTKFTCRFFRKGSNRTCILIAYICGTYWAAETLQASSLLACMCLGAFLINIFAETNHLQELADHITPPLFMIFFIISGAGFQISELPRIGLIGILYVVLRVIGKMLGAYSGGKLTHQEEKICKYLGPTLMPQAGVALGLIIAAGKVLPDYAGDIRTIILCSTFIYSIIGPIVAKSALEKAGEIVIPKKQKKL